MWEKVDFLKVVKDKTGGNTKLSQDKYLPSGKYPIIDQGEGLIGGYYDKDITVKVKNPVVVFGDHSKCLKFIDFNFILGADGVKVLEPREDLDAKYLYYFLQTVYFPNVGYSRHYKFLKENQIPLPPLPIQEKIATILDKADELRRKDQELLTKYDELAQAIFIDMFGDPVRNEKGWEVKKLGDFGNLKNGLNYSQNESGNSIKTIGVGDFKSNWLFNDFNTLGSLQLTSFPHVDFLLKNDDIVFVRSNGNKELIGRSMLIKNLNEQITFSGFCIRYRKNSSSVNSLFLIRLLTSKVFKKYILKGGRGANIQNINQEILNNLTIPIPPLSLQEEFAKKIELINTLKTQASAKKSEELFQSLLQKAFKGELMSLY